MHKTSTRLADGRELIYYDIGAERRDDPPDPRDLPPRTAVSHIRLDPLTGEPVIIANHRQRRIFQPSAGDCPLCPSRDGKRTEIPATRYDVAVFENRFPALTPLPGSVAAPAEATGDLLRSMPAGGRCEVICFSDDHDTTFAALKPEQARLVLDAWIDRTRDLSAMPGVVEVFCFENRGPEMGVTQPHPHGQIYAFPFVTPRTARMTARAAAHRREHGRNLFEDVLDAECADGRRIVAANAEWVAFVPYAARWPYEAHLYPRRRRPDLTGLDEAQRDAFTALYLDTLQRFDRLFETPTPYVAAWHQAPTGSLVDAAGAADFAVHLELFTNRRGPDRLKVLGGTEVGMDTFSNDIGPEQAAARLRDLG